MSGVFSLFMEEWIGARNKPIAREPLRGLRDSFVHRSDSFLIVELCIALLCHIGQGFLAFSYIIELRKKNMQ